MENKPDGSVPNGRAVPLNGWPVRPDMFLKSKYTCDTVEIPEATRQHRRSPSLGKLLALRAKISCGAMKDRLSYTLGLLAALVLRGDQ